MTNTSQQQTESTDTLTRGVGLPGRITVSFGVGGGVLLGGFLIAWMTLMGKLSGSGLLLATTGLFGLGGLFGLLHGGLLGVLGRPEGMTRTEAGKSVFKSLLYAFPALAIGWLVSGWISMTIMARHIGEVLPWVGVAAGWGVGLFLLLVAGSYGLRGFKLAYARWPQRVPGTTLTAVMFAALAYIFWTGNPAALFGFQVELTNVGAVLAAGMATIWVVGPLVTVSLRELAHMGAEAPSPRLADGKQVALNVGLGLGIGVALAALALPFYGPPLQVPMPIEGVAPSAVLGFALSHALINEIVLRLGLVSMLAWVLYRFYEAGSLQAATAAIVGVALIQLGLYMPAILSVGFPTTLAAIGFAATAVVIPALALGALFWSRGLSAAITAETAALGTLALLA